MAIDVNLQGLFDEIEKRLSRIRAMAVVAAAAAEEELEAEYWLLAEDLASEGATVLEELHEKTLESHAETGGSSDGN